MLAIVLNGSDVPADLAPFFEDAACGTCYVCQLLRVFRGVRRALRPDGTLWLNLGDSYANDSKWGGQTGGKHVAGLHGSSGIGRSKRVTGGQSKALHGIPWRVALALQADNWYLRSAIVWAKPNPMPESVRDRPTSAYEHVFLLTKQSSYYYDAAAIAEPSEMKPQNRFTSRDAHPKGDAGRPSHRRPPGGTAYATRNARNVWTISPKVYKGAHFATMPIELAERCIKAGSRRDDLVLDPFAGAGTTGLAAVGLGRRATLIDLNPDYVALARQRIDGLLGAGALALAW